MPEIFSFSTDFLHPEGDMEPTEKIAVDISSLGDTAIKAFFVSDAELYLAA